MSVKQIPNLPAATALSGNEELEIVQAGVSRRTTAQAIADLNPPQGTVTQIDTAGGLSGGPITTTGTIQIAGGGVDNTKLADMPAQTVKGNDGITLGPPSDITMGTLSTMLSLAPSATIDTTNANNITSGQLSDERYYLTLSDAINRMVNLTNTPFQSAVLYLGPSGWTTLSPGIPGQVLRTQGVGVAPEWFTTTGTGTVQEVNTGTGLVGGPITTIGTISIDVTGVTAASYGGLPSQTLSFSVNAQGQLTTAATVNIAIDANQVTTGTLAVARGGTGLASYTVGDLIFASGSTTLSKLAAGTADYVLTSNGLNLPPSYKQVNLTTGVTGTLPVANGGTGAVTLTGYVKGNGTSAFTANPTIPNTDITGLGTMSVQNAGSVAITGGTATLSSAALTSGTISTAPVNATDITNKAYVDSVAEGLRTRPSARAATTANLSATYNNGASGVGATLTSTTNGAFPTLDGVSGWAVTSPPQGVLVKNQTNPAQNGRYNLTQLGDGSNPWILTRCGLCDQSNEIPGSYIFVTDGTLYADTGWVLSVADPATFVIGTDAINVLQFSGAGTYLAGTGLTLTGNTFSITNTAVTPASYGSASSVATFTVNAQGQLTAAANAAIAIDASAITSGTLGVVRGGTGLSSVAAGDLLYGSATNTLSTLAGAATNNVLLSGGVSGAPSWGKVDLTTAVSGTLPITSGGTGQTSAAAAFDGLAPTTTRGDIIYRNATTNTRLAVGTANYALLSDGTDPVWGQVSLTAGVTGTLPAANGGTGISSYAVGDILYASGTTTLSKLAAAAAGSVLISNGAGVAPSWSSTVPATAGVIDISFGSTGLTPATATQGNVIVGGTLNIANGGTGATTVAGAQTNLQVDPAGTAIAMSIALG